MELAHVRVAVEAVVDAQNVLALYPMGTAVMSAASSHPAEATSHNEDW